MTERERNALRKRCPKARRCLHIRQSVKNPHRLTRTAHSNTFPSRSQHQHTRSCTPEKIGRIFCVCFCNESVPSFKQEVFVFTANSGHRHEEGANSFSKFLFSPYVIQPLKTSSWQWLLKRTASATHPAEDLPMEPGWSPPPQGHSVAGVATPVQNWAPLCWFHLWRTLPPPAGLLIWWVSRLLPCSGVAGRISPPDLLLTKRYTPPSHSHRKWWKTDCVCVYSGLSRKGALTAKMHIWLNIHCHTTRGSCDILWLPSKVAGISLIWCLNTTYSNVSASFPQYF